MFLFGRYLYGTVDQIVGVCHVRTMFFHFMFFPLLPYETFIVVELGDGRATAYPIARSWKSLWFAWGRAFLTILFLIFGSASWDFFAADPKPGYKVTAVWTGVVALATVAVIVLSYRMSLPGDARRDYLLQLVSKARDRELGEG